jgi:hypothetical protein
LEIVQCNIPPTEPHQELHPAAIKPFLQNPGRYAANNGVRWNGPVHNSARCNNGSIPNHYSLKYLRSTSDPDIVPNYRGRAKIIPGARLPKHISTPIRAWRRGSEPNGVFVQTDLAVKTNGTKLADLA